MFSKTTINNTKTSNITTIKIRITENNNSNNNTEGKQGHGLATMKTYKKLDETIEKCLLIPGLTLKLNAEGPCAIRFYVVDSSDQQYLSQRQNN